MTSGTWGPIWVLDIALVFILTQNFGLPVLDSGYFLHLSSTVRFVLRTLSPPKYNKISDGGVSLKEANFRSTMSG